MIQQHESVYFVALNLKVAKGDCQKKEKLLYLPEFFINHQNIDTMQKKHLNRNSL